jgi:hypothetical protein
MMELRTQIRADINDLKQLCQTHDITICEIAERSMFNHLNFGQVIKTAAGFATQEDLAMVRLLMGKK